MKDKTSPREKILKLIDADPKGTAETASKTSRPGGMRLWQKLQKVIYFVFHPAKMRGHSHKQTISLPHVKKFDINKANKLLAVILIIFSGLVIFQFSAKGPDINILLNKLAQLSPASIPDNIIENFFPAEAYITLAKKRNIFEPYKIEVKQVAVAPTAPKFSLKDEIKNLKLIGIYWGESPEVIIKDTKKNSTHFLRTGQTIGKLKIKTILREKAILSYNEEEIDLTR